MAQLLTAEWSKKPLNNLMPVFMNHLELLHGNSVVNVDMKDYHWQVFINSRPVKKVGHDRFHPYCRFRPEYLTLEQVVARLEEWQALKFDWETELVEFKQVRIVKTDEGYLWCSQRMEHYPAAYLHKRLKEAAIRISATPKEYSK